MNIPIYKAVFEEDEMIGVTAISVVDNAAFRTEFLTFKAEEMKFAGDDKKQILYGAVIVPDRKVYREEMDGTPYYIVFDAETIENLNEYFHKNNFRDNSNINHSNQKIDMTLVESFIIKNQEMSDALVALGLDSYPVGTWIAGMKIYDEDVYYKALNGQLNGFSMEVMISKELKLNNFSEININNMNNKKEKAESLFQQIVDLFVEKESEATEEKFADIPLEDGTLLVIDDESKRVTSPEGIEDGTYPLADGGSVVIEGGIVTEMIEPEEEPVEEEEVVEEEVVAEEEVKAEEEPMEEEEMKKEEEKMEQFVEVETVDGQKLFVEESTGNVFIIDGEERVPAPAGEYPLMGGMTLVVDEDGKMVDVYKEYTQLQKDFTDLTLKFSELETEYDALKTKFDAQPAVAATKTKKPKEVKVEEMSTAQRYAHFAKNRDKLSI